MEIVMHKRGISSTLRQLVWPAHWNLVGNVRTKWPSAC